MSGHKLKIFMDKRFVNAFVLVVILLSIIASMLFLMSACSNDTESNELNKAKDQAIDNLQTYRDSKDNSLYSEINIKILNDLLIMGIEAIKSSSGQEQITAILVKFKFDMDSVLTKENEYDSEVKALALYKIEKDKELNVYRAEFNDENYSAENVSQLNSILSKFCNLVFMAETYEIVDTLIFEAKAAMDSIPNIENESKLNLLDYKNTAINIVTEYRANMNDTLYSYEGLKRLDKCFLDCIIMINDAMTITQIDEIVMVSKEKLDSILNSAEEIMDYNEKSILQLEFYRAMKDDKDYSNEGVQLLNTTLAKFIEAIKLANTILDIENQFNKGKLELDRIYTLSEELEYVKNNAIKELKDHRESKIDYYYSEDGISALDTILLNGILAINSALNKNSVENALESAMNALDSIIVADEELVGIKVDAINDLILFRQGKNNDEYTDDAVLILDKTLEDGTYAINMAVSIDEVAIALSNAKNIINSIKTIVQEITERKIEYISLLEEYRQTKNNDEYSIDGVSQLDEALAEGVLLINLSNTFEEIEEVFEKYISIIDSVKNCIQELQELREQSLRLLNEYRFTKNDGDYTLQGLKLLSEIVTLYEKIIRESNNSTSINEALLSAKNEMDNVKTYSAELFDAKVNAQRELENYRESKADELYSVRGIALLNKETSDGVYNISNVDTFEDLDQALKTAKYNIDIVPTLIDELQMMKDNAINELTEYRNSKNDDEYSTNGLLSLDLALSQGIDKINCADSESEITILINEIKASIDSVKTFVTELKETKLEAILELELYRKSKNEANYTANGIAQLNLVLENGINSINEALSIDDIEFILQNSKELLDNVMTAEQEIIELKNLAEQELIKYRDQKIDTEYSPKSVELLNIALQDGISAIKNSKTQLDIESALSEARAKIDAVPTYVDELSTKKLEAIEILKNLRLEKNENDYSDNAIETMDSIFNNGIKLINSSTSLEEVDSALENAISEINEIKTKTEEANYLSQFKVDLVNRIITYRETLPIENYSTEGVESIDNILSNAITLINIAVSIEEAQNVYDQAIVEMEEVPKYSDELAEVKNNAFLIIKEYRESKDDELYKEEFILEMDKKVENAIFDINNAIYLSDVQSVVDRVKAELDNIPTKLQEAKIEARNLLIEYRETKAQNEYAQEELQELDAIIENSFALIENAVTIDEVDNIVLDAKKALDEVITYSEKVEIAKEVALQELQDYRNSIDESLYDIESLNQLNAVTEKGIVEIKNCVELEEINHALAKAKADINDIKTNEVEIGGLTYVGV